MCACDGDFLRCASNERLVNSPKEIQHCAWALRKSVQIKKLDIFSGIKACFPIHLSESLKYIRLCTLQMSRCHDVLCVVKKNMKMKVITIISLWEI
jgi:hypothetical protein